MGRRSKLTPELRQAVITKVAGGMSSERCAEWLNATHGIKITGHSVAKMVRARRSEHADAAKTVVREHLQKTIPSDLALIDRDIQLINHIVVRAMNTDNPELALRALAERRKSIDTKLHYVGADQPDEGVIGALTEFLATVLGD